MKFMLFPVLNVGLAHSGSQPFICESIVNWVEIASGCFKINPQ